jgi:hypothetical protein
MAPGDVADRVAQGLMDSLGGAIGGPPLEVVEDRLPRRKIMRQLPPRAAGTGQYRIASTTRRRGYLGGRPPRVPRPRALRTGTSGSISVHCASVRSEG